VFLRLNGWRLDLDDEQAHAFLTRPLESHTCDFEHLLPWIRQSLTTILPADLPSSDADERIRSYRSAANCVTGRPGRARDPRSGLGIRRRAFQSLRLADRVLLTSDLPALRR
jgi:hypothetical protein